MEDPSTITGVKRTRNEMEQTDSATSSSSNSSERGDDGDPLVRAIQSPPMSSSTIAESSQERSRSATDQVNEIAERAFLSDPSISDFQRQKLMEGMQVFKRELLDFIDRKFGSQPQDSVVITAEDIHEFSESLRLKKRPRLD